MNPWEIDWNKPSDTTAAETPPWEKDWTGSATPKPEEDVKYVRNPFTGELKPVPSIGPDLSPGIRSFLADSPGAAAGTLATGQAMTATQPLRASPYMPVRAAGTLGPLIYGLIAAMGTSAATKKLLPQEIEQQLAKDAQDNPTQVAIGGLASQLPYFRPGALESSVAEFLKARAVPAAIGAGLAGGTDLATTGELNPKDMLLAAATNAILNKPTQLGEATMGLGANLGGNQANSIISKLGNIKAKGAGGVIPTNQVANEIALEPIQDQTPDLSGLAQRPDALSQLMLAKGQGDLTSPAGAPPAVNEGMDLGAVFPDQRLRGSMVLHDPLLEEWNLKPERRKPKLDLTDINGPAPHENSPEILDAAKQQVEDQAFSQAVEDAKQAQKRVDDMLTAKKAEANAAGLAKELGFKSPEVINANPVKDVPVSDFVGIQDNGNGGKFELWNIPKGEPNAGSTLSRESIEKLGYKVPEVSDEMIKAAQAKQKAEQDRINGLFANKPANSLDLSPSEPGKATETPKVEQNPVKPTETPSNGPSLAEPELPYSIKQGKMVDAFDREIVRNPETKRYELVDQPKGVNQAGEAGVLYNPFGQARTAGIISQVDTIHFQPNTDGTVAFVGESLSGKSGKYGKTPTEIFHFNRANEAQLTEMLGPDVANRILDAAKTGPGTIKGLTSADFASKSGMSSEAGGILHPAEIYKAASEQAGKALEKVNEPLLERMSKVETEKNNPTNPVFDQFTGKSTTASESNPSDVKQESGRTTKEAESINRKIRSVNKENNGLLPTYDSVTNKEIPENIKENAKTLYQRLISKAKDNDVNGLNSPEEVNNAAYQVSQAPEAYKPLLTDLASQFPWMGKTPGVKQVAEGIGSVSKVLKKGLGVLETNIQEHSKRTFGALREYVFKKNEMLNDYEARTKVLGKEARENLTPDEFERLNAANLSGDRADAEAIFNTKPPKVAKKLLEAYDMNQEAKAELRQKMLDSGMEVGEVENYFHRKLIDRKGLLEAIGAEEPNAYDDMLKNLARSKDKTVTELSQEEKDQALNNLVVGSFRGKGKGAYLKPRTIEKVTQDLAKFYEPFDVADHDYVSRAVRDLLNKEYFVKIRFEVSNGERTPINGTFGRILNEEIASGRLDKNRGFNEVNEALQDYFQNTHRYDEGLNKMANGIRRFQSYMYLGDVANALPQLGDFFNGLMHYGLKAGTTGFLNRKFNLADLKINEGVAHDLQEYRKQGGPGFFGKVYQPVLRRILGTADAIGKSGLANDAYRWVQDVAKKPDSREFIKLSKQYSEAFGEKRWNEILTDLKSPEFAKGQLNDNTRFFLFNELSNLQPIDAAGRAQYYNRASPWGKMLYSLRSYALKQVDYMRREIYDEFKAGNPKQAFGKMMAYLVLVGAGQQALSYVKDKILGRDATPEEYAVTGALQLMMIPRFAVFKFQQEGAASAAIKTLIPGVSAVDDMTKDAMLINAAVQGQKDVKGNKTVQDAGDLFRQLRTIQYLPGIGRELYWWGGRGAAQEQKQQAQAAKGKSPKTTYELLSDIVSPPDLKTQGK